MKKGTFIVFEGIDGSGKTTQIELLAKHMTDRGRKPLITREPSDGPVGVLLRQFLTGRIKGDTRMIASLFASDRLDHITNPTDGLLERLESGADIISDRYCFSSYAYNSVDMDLDWVISVNSESMRLMKPDLVIFIDVPVETALERISENRFSSELFEERERLEKVRENYLKSFERFSDTVNIVTFDGTGSVDEIASQIAAAFDKYITEI